MTSRPRVGILSTFGYETKSAGFLERLVRVESGLSSSVHVIAPDQGWENLDNVVFHRTAYKVGSSFLSQALNQMVSQVRMSILLVRLRAQVDFLILYGADVMLLPSLSAKLGRVKFLVALAGNLEKEAQMKKNPLNRVQLTLRRCVLALADKIVLFSPVLISQWQMERYSRKILIADSHFLDLSLFSAQTTLSERAEMVGYIGRLSSEKGILNFLRAIPLIHEAKPDARFLIVGSGPLKDEVSLLIKVHGMTSFVSTIDHIPQTSVPHYLNMMKLCVLPSYTEGMPNIVLEAMACGTPVIATPVGAIPDVIQDGLTGYIMEDNSPSSIARNVLRALNASGIGSVSKEGRLLVERRFTFEMAKRSFLRMQSQVLQT